MQSNISLFITAINKCTTKLILRTTPLAPSLQPVHQTKTKRSLIGLGGLKVSKTTHKNKLAKGCTLIDSATNYNPILKTTESPTSSISAERHNFRPCQLHDQLSTCSSHHIHQIVEDLQRLTIYAHMAEHAYVTPCQDCGKPYYQVNEETVTDFLHQIAEPH